MKPGTTSVDFPGLRARKNYRKASDQFKKAHSLRPGMQSALVNTGQA